jgi:hypothetical protein
MSNRGGSRNTARHAANASHLGRPAIVVHDHDVLSGRGVNIAQHPGNERFRALVQSRYDENYCQHYTVTEKRAVAEDIISHIRSLNPPGRFLKRSGRSSGSRGLSGPWEELSAREVVRKTCQALRDCNRSDRSGYAAAVAIPDDVRASAEHRQQLGLTNKQLAEHIAAASKQQQQQQQQEDDLDALEAAVGRTLSPSIENAAEWLKKPRLEPDLFQHTPMTTSTLTTAASSGAMMPNTDSSSLMDSFHGSPSDSDHHLTYHATHLPPPSPTFQDTADSIAYCYQTSLDIEDMKSSALDPLQEAAAAMQEGVDYTTPFDDMDDVLHTHHHHHHSNTGELDY